VPKVELPEGLARVPGANGMAVWGKVSGYGAKLHEVDGSPPWLSFAIYVRQPKNEFLTVFINWRDFTWVPTKKELVICQGVPILRISEGGRPFLTLRCYESKGVRKAIET